MVVSNKRENHSIDDYDEYYEQVQSEKKKRLEKRKRKNLLTMVGVCLLGASLIFASVSALLSFKKNEKPLSVPSASVVPSSMPPEQSSVFVQQPDHPMAADTSLWYLPVISEKYPVDASYPKPETKQVVEDNSNAMYEFDTRMADFLVQMRADCNVAVPGVLAVSSGWASYNYHQKTYNYYIEQYRIMGYSEEEAAQQAAKQIDPPGTADAHTGLAAYFFVAGSNTQSANFAQTAQFAWLLENSASYGFVLRYPEGKEGITGKEFRPWHFRFVGTEEARTMNENNLCLEEYVGKI